MRNRALVVLSMLSASMTLATATPASAAPSGFVTRSGTQLMLDGEPFTFTGYNIYFANSDGWCGPAWGSGNSLDQALTEMGPGQEVIRAWFFQGLAIDNTTREWDWSAFDHTLQVAGAHGFKVIVTLTDQWGECGDDSLLNGYKDRAWYESGYKRVQPGMNESYRDWVVDVVSRYRDDPRVAFWQLINEAEVAPCPPGDPEPHRILKDWATDVSGLMKSIDANHLVSLGTLGNGQCGASFTDYEDLHSIPTIDLCEYHDYDEPDAPMPGDQWNGLAFRIQQCQNLNKPIFVGEAGIRPQELDGTYEARAAAFQAKIDAQFTAGVQGFLAWSWGANGPTPDSWDIGLGDPSLDALRGPTPPEFGADGDILEIDPPASVRPGAMEDNSALHAFAEQQATYVVGNGLATDISRPGTYNEASPSLTPKTMPIGSAISSYLVHGDNVGNVVPEVLSGTITFPRPVLGIVIGHGKLTTSDKYGASGTAYPSTSAQRQFRGLDFSGTTNGIEDSVTLSADRMTVTLTMQISDRIDQIRVITMGLEPQTQIEPPRPDLYYRSGTSVSLSFSSPTPSSTFQCRLNTGSWQACTSPWNIASTSAAKYIAHVRAKNPSGDFDPTPSVVWWRVDATAPNTTIASGPSGTVTSSSATFTFTSSETPKLFDCSLDGAAYQHCTSPRTLSDVGAGFHTFRVRARDAAGNVDATPAARSWTVVAPDALIL